MSARECGRSVESRFSFHRLRRRIARPDVVAGTRVPPPSVAQYTRVNDARPRPTSGPETARGDVTRGRVIYVVAAAATIAARDRVSPWEYVTGESAREKFSRNVFFFYFFAFFRAAPDARSHVPRTEATASGTRDRTVHREKSADAYTTGSSRNPAAPMPNLLLPLLLLLLLILLLTPTATATPLHRAPIANKTRAVCPFPPSLPPQ